ncbi:MAG: stalk domain-containing protein [Armatimonadota bacterium]
MNGGAVAVILLLNGLQIGLPAPAFVQDGCTWYPARTVLTTAGFEVSYDRDHQQVTVAEAEALFSVDMQSLRITPAREDVPLTAVEARREDGLLYLPAQTLGAIGLQVQWDNENKTLHVRTPHGATTRLTIRDLLKNPLKWLSRSVRVHGEYAGTEEGAGAADDATRFWRLRGEDSTILCTDAPDTGLRRAAMEPFERVVVTGCPRMLTNGILYLEVERQKPAEGPASLSITLMTDRERYQPGDTVVIEAEWSNLLEKPIKIFSPPQLRIINHSGQQFWQQTLQMPETVPPHEQSNGAFTWTIPEDAMEGTYRLQLTHADLWAYQCLFEVDERP